MKIIYLLLASIFIDWISHPFLSNTWMVDKFFAYWYFSLLSQTLVYFSRHESLKIRSILGMICIGFWLNLLAYILWIITDKVIDIAPYIAIFSLVFLGYLIKKQYQFKSDKFNPLNINLLLLKPRTTWDVIKAFLGVPVSSICIGTGEYVWAFRQNTQIFERAPYGDAWLKKHLVIDTGIQCTKELVQELDNIIGESRYPYCKCIWSIKKVLNKMGGLYSINSFLDYIPGIYVSKIIKDKKWISKQDLI